MLYGADFTVLRVVLVLLGLASPRHPLPVDRVWEAADAIVFATDDVPTQDRLARIAFYESGLRRSVLGDRGRSIGMFQIQPITPRDRVRALSSARDQAVLALEYVRRSAEACPGNVGADTLAMYVSGSCQRGLREARHRWGPE